MHPSKTISSSRLPWLLILASQLCTVGPASAQALNGNVNLSGVILDAACSVKLESQDQTVAMAPTAISGMVNGETTVQQSFTLELVNCGPSRATAGQASGNPLTLIFEGIADGPHFLSQGSAQGVALRIQDRRGNAITPGVPVREHIPPSGDMTLAYLLRLSGTGSALKAGDYHITVRLRMNYF